MQDLLTTLSTLRRPRSLIRAARLGVHEYNRNRHLQRILGYGSIPRPAEALMRLMEQERALNDQRRENDACYSLVRHLDLLIAMMGEAQLLKANRTSP